MKYYEILINNPETYYGYQLNFIAESRLDIKDLKMYRKLERTPAKISRFLDKTKIKQVFKSDCFKNPLLNYYLVQAVDDTVFYLEY